MFAFVVWVFLSNRLPVIISLMLLTGVDLESHGTGYLLERMFKEGLVSKEEALTKRRKADWRFREDDY